MKNKLSLLSIAVRKIRLLASYCKKNMLKGALPGEFSVSDTKKIHFSKGNLYFNGSEFVFEDKQYEFHGYNSGSNIWGFFGWSTGSTNYGMSTSTSRSDYSGEFNDWGKAIGNGNTWRTLSQAEWIYLINNNDDDNVRKGKFKYGVRVCEKANCLILAPDDFEGVIAESYDAAAWKVAESEGLVCLPAAGYRIGNSMALTNGGGLYWSSSAHDEDLAYHLGFIDYGVFPGNPTARDGGLSVRLITECQ